MASAPLILFDETNETTCTQERFVSIPIHDGKGRLTGKFPKSARLLTRAHYKHLHKNSTRLFGDLISVDIRQGRSFSAKLGITVSRKFGKAHERNRFKRVVREAFREIYLSLPQDLELNVIPRKKGMRLSKQAILIDLQKLLSSIRDSSRKLIV
jgi:ribonuclease P protein component